jgi:aminopeptidase N
MAAGSLDAPLHIELQCAHQMMIADINKLLNPNSYQKGAWVLHMLRMKVGDSLFHQGLRDYYSVFRLSNADSDDFRIAMEESTGIDLSEFFEIEREKYKTIIQSIKNDEDVDITYLKSQFIELYDKVNDKLECPVCFEILTKDKIEVPNCGHLICKVCKETICKSSCKCPICKKKYFVKPS